jgi:hypothetical protein
MVELLHEGGVAAGVGVQHSSERAEDRLAQRGRQNAKERGQGRTAEIRAWWR